MVDLDSYQCHISMLIQSECCFRVTWHGCAKAQYMTSLELGDVCGRMYPRRLVLHDSHFEIE
jgi:hypothetical protein